MVFHWQNLSHLTWVPNTKISCRILYRGNELYCTHPITQIYYSSTLRGYHHFNYNIDWKIIIKKFMIGSIYMRFETHSTLKVSYKQNVDVQSIVATGRDSLLSLLQHFYKDMTRNGQQEECWFAILQRKSVMESLQQ